jgi:MoxR-like ATPase
MSNAEPPQDHNAPAALVAEAQAAVEALSRVRNEVAKTVFGQERVVELTLAAILAGGHALLLGAPGLAKTTLVEAIARVLGMPTARVQFRMSRAAAASASCKARSSQAC